VSPSISLSVSPSISPSPSPGWKGYTKGNYAVLPTDDSELETVYTDQEITDVATENSVWVAQTGLLEYTIHQYKNYVGSETNCVLTWKGRTNLAPSSSTVYLQIYNLDTLLWETVDSDNSSAVDTNFTLTAVIADLTDYKDVTGSMICRIYQFDTVSPSVSPSASPSISPSVSPSI